MTPEAVIYRYLELLRNTPLDRAALVRLLSLDADLLGRWLTSLACDADPRALDLALEALTEAELKILAQSHAWAMLPTLGSARLAMDQWQLVGNAAFLAEQLAERLGEDGVRAASVADPSRVRMQVLLATSGVNLTHDVALTDLGEFRGTPVGLLLDSDPLPQILAIVEAFDTDGAVAAAELAEVVFGWPQSEFAALRSSAESECARELRALQLIADDSVDWGERLWLQQRLMLLHNLYPAHGEDSADLIQAHETAARALFGSAPELFIAEGDAYWRALLGASVRIRQNSSVSAIAEAARDGASRTLTDDPAAPLADRQVLRYLQADEALVLPVLSEDDVPQTLAVLVFSAADDLEPDYTMRAYAGLLADWLSSGNELRPSKDADQLDEFRAQEQKRLRELVHEANNPLSIVHNYLHILELRLGDEPSTREQLQLIGSEMRRAAAIIQQMKDVPLEPQQPATIDVVRAAFDLNALVRQVCELSEGAAQEADIELERWLALGELTVESDRDLVAQILTNLVKNAIEACSAGDTISLATHGAVVRDGTPGLEVVVQDSGPGLPESVLAQLWQEKASHQPGHEGLGLHLVHRLVTALGGHIDVRTSPETGTAFNVFLPGNAPH